MDFNRIFSDFLTSSGRTILSISKGVILIPIITRLMGADSYGQWAAIIAFVAIVTNIGNLHLKGALIRYTPREDESGETVSQLLVLAAVAVLVISSFILLLETRVSVIPSSGLPSTIIFAVISLVSAEIITSVIYNYPRSNGDVKSYEVIQVVRLVIEIAALSTVLYVTRDLVTAILTLAFVKAVLAGCVLLYYRPISRITLDPNKVKMYLTYSLPMVPKEIGSKLLTNADKYLLLYLASPAAAGIYAVAYSGSTLLYGLTSALNPTLYPNVVRAWDEEEYSELQELYYEIYKWYSLIGIPACCGLILLSWPILRLLSTPDIAYEGQIVFSILVVAFFVRGFDNPIMYILHAAERNDLVAYINIIAASANVFLNIALIPIYGLYGAVLATVVANLVITLYIYIKVNKLVGLNFPIKIVVKSVFASLLMMTILSIFLQDIGWWQKLIAFPILGVVSYSAIIYISGGISDKELTQLSNVVR
ncbi:lipopolysaccharide biosynthesis protein [Haloferacaceae archaeon DSL9]